ncbi:MAG: RDD family protein [Myxococcota bacterium]|nr:RDD family protein [Myxococcota bacterium]
MTAPASHETTSDGWRQELRSPEQVSLHLPTAGPTSRILAYFLDSLIVLLLLTGLLVSLILVLPAFGELLAGILGEIVGDPQSTPTEEEAVRIVYLFLALFLVAQLVVELGYFSAWEILSGGRSPGKMALRLRVVDDHGLPVRPAQSIVRNLLRVVDALPLNYVVGLLSMILSRDARRLGDHVAGTLVVRLDRPPPAPPLPPVQAGEEAIAAFRLSHAQLAAIGPGERRLVRQTLRRLPELPPERAREVAARSADALARRIGHDPIPPEEGETVLRALLHAAERR